jgi:hypothetical protein
MRWFRIPPPGRRALRLLCVALVAASGCTSAPRRSVAELGFGSVEALSAAVLEGLARRDRAFLEGLALSEAELRTIVWPGLPAARPERNLSWDYVWQDLLGKSQGSLSTVLARHGGKRYRLVSVNHRGPTTSYAGFDVQRRTEISVRTATGEVLALRLFGSTIARDGQYKLFSYVVD